MDIVRTWYLSLAYGKCDPQLELMLDVLEGSPKLRFLPSIKCHERSAP
jgi:hypothetical protein